MRVADLTIWETPWAVVDIETTGVAPGLDRIIEVCVIRLDPESGTTYRAFDTLVRPHRDITTTAVHGIDDAAVASAPTFRQVSRRLLDALEGSVLVAHNARFDVRFLQAEFGAVDYAFDPPHLCTMALPCALGLAPGAVSLEQLCGFLGVPLVGAHMARNDVQATAMAAMMMRHQLQGIGVKTYGQLAKSSRGGWLSFFDTFERPLIQAPAPNPLPECDVPLQPRVEVAQQDAPEWADQMYYLSELEAAVSDYQISRAQLARLRDIQVRSGLHIERVRAVHARVFAQQLADFAGDEVLSDDEVAKLRLLTDCLRNLGWSPGD